MPAQQKGLFFMNFFFCGVAKVAIKLFGHKRLTPYYGHFCRMQMVSTILSKHQLQQALSLKRAISLAARYTPWNSNCLTQALVAKFWCTYKQIPYMLFIGFEKNSEKPLGENSHAWVMAGPIAISGGFSFNTHQVILSYSNINFKELECEAC